MATTIQQIETPKHARALDTSGNNNHGQIYSGRGLEFDGVTDYMKPVGAGNLSASSSVSWGKGKAGDYNIVTNAHNREVQLKLTACFWVKFNAVGKAQYFFDSAGGEWWARLSGSNKIHVGYLSNNYEETVDGVDGGDGDFANVSGTGTKTLDTNNWYRIVVNYNMQEGTAAETFKIYINGVLDPLSSSGEIGSTGIRAYRRATADFSLRIGDYGDGVRDFLDGALADYQIWYGNFTAEDAMYDYLNPESLALNRSGTSLEESHLKLWYPMQDGHRGQQSYVLDASNTGLGDEMVTNGDFSDGLTNWDFSTAAASATHEIVNGKLKLYSGTAADNSNVVVQTTGYMSGVSGVTYKLTVDVSDFVGSAQGHVRLDGNQDSGVDKITIKNGANTKYFKAYEDFTFIRFVTSSSEDGYTIDNVSLKPVNDKNNATTVFYGDNLITAVKDRALTSGSNWVDSSITVNQWTQDGGTYNEDATSGADESTVLTAYDGTTVTFVDNYLELVATSDGDHLRLANLDGGSFGEANMVVGRTYRLSYAIDLTAYTSGTLHVGFGETSASEADARKAYTAITTLADGTESPKSDFFDFIYKGTTTHAKLFIQAGTSSAFTVYFDNFSIKEVGLASGWTDADQQLHIPQTALQSYNELAWCAGGNENVQVNALAAGLGTNNFAISYVLHPEDVSGDNRFLSFEETSNSGRVVHQIDDGVLEIYIEEDGGSSSTFAAASSAGALVNGNTYHIVESFDRTSNLVTTFINGQATGVTIDISGISGDAIDCNGRLSIYQHQTTGDMSIQGFVTELALWKNTTFNATTVNELYNDGKPLDALTHSQSSTLYGYWRNNGLNTWVNLANPGTKDSTSNTMTETMICPSGVDSSRCSQGFIMNKPRNTSNLNLTNGSDSPYVDLGTETDITAGSAASIIAWLKPDDLVDNYFIGANTAEDSIRIHSSTAIKIKADNEDALAFDVGNGDMVAGEWFHFAATKDTDNVWKIYIDGVQNGSASADTEDNDEPLGYRYLGSSRLQESWGKWNFRGQADGFLIYSDELSSAEVQRNYKATKGSHRN